MRDHKDYETFLKWLQAHSPFDFSNQQLVAISTGLVADSSVNCDQAKEIGKTAANAITRRVFSEVKLKCSDKEWQHKCSKHNQSSSTNSSGQSNLAVQLFNKITCVLKNSTEMEEYLLYELSPQPLALFHDSTMRKTKSALGLLLKSKVKSTSRELQVDCWWWLSPPSCYLATEINIWCCVWSLSFLYSETFWVQHFGCLWWISE